MFDVSVAACATYEPAICRQALLQVLAPLGGLDFVSKGMKIAIKANLVAAMRPERAATTHPELLLQLALLLQERGATVMIGDSPGGLYQAAFVENVYRATGLTAVERPGISLNRNYAQKIAQFPAGRVAKSFAYTAYLDDCDVIIDFCKLKSHGMMGMSAAAKNLFGTIPGTRKPEYHFQYPDPRDFARMLVDLCQYWKPQLCIVDGVEGMEGNGPTAGTPRSIGALLASPSPHAVDLLCAELIGLRRQAVPTLEAAYERQLIPAEASALTVFGPSGNFYVPDFRRSGAQRSHLFTGSLPGKLGQMQSHLLRQLIGSYPRVSPKDCIGCSKCAEICPAHAIGMEHGKPHIDRHTCIRCFCCQEFCPKGAMEVQRTPIARLLSR